VVQIMALTALWDVDLSIWMPTLVFVDFPDKKDSLFASWEDTLRG